jgi:hypothetical protein
MCKYGCRCENLRLRVKIGEGERASRETQRLETGTAGPLHLVESTPLVLKTDHCNALLVYVVSKY